MERFWNEMKARAAGLDGMAGVARFGLVTSFDPAAYAARVQIQPENVLSGWLPILSNWVGNGWGMAAPLTPGDQVLILAQEGDAEQGVVVGCVWSTIDKSLNAPSGELWMQHQTGSFIKLCNDGSVAVQATTVKITGDLLVTGNTADQDGAHGTLAALRTAYDGHTHPVEGAQTGLPSMVV